MGNILIDKVRVFGFRGIKDLELSLGKTTVLTGMNNTGKTSIIKAIQLALGNRSFLSIDDFHIEGNRRAERIFVDIRFIQLDENNAPSLVFDDEWESVFKEDKIKISDDLAYVPIRIIIKYNLITNKFDTEQQILTEWDAEAGEHWTNIRGDKKPFLISEQIPFFYVDAKRDIIDDMKLKSSYLGRLLSNLKYKEEDITNLEGLISEINEQAVNKSDVLKIIQTSLKEINTTVDNNGTIDITPFAKRIRDLNKNISINYGEEENSFTMDFHGMGTRSWSSLLTLKAFISYNDKMAKEEDLPFFPIIAIEEPESHLHPNAQKKLYTQMNSIHGQKIISTHSPYIAASSELSEIRVLNKKDNNVLYGSFDITSIKAEDIRKLRQKVISLRGEIFFAKALVFFEGETEEQALPLFAEKHWKIPAHELGVNFIGVGGAGQYLPFLRFAEAFKIPWFIFSDGEAGPLKSVQKAVREVENDTTIDIAQKENIIILEDGLDFEGYILRHGYIEEVEKAISTIHSDIDYIQKWIDSKDGTTSKGQEKTDEKCDTCKQNIYVQKTRNYTDDDGYYKALDDIMEKDKTMFAPIITKEIIDSDKGLPLKVTLLLDKINNLLKS